eukprot:CAMPEP_0175611126 /NCGR_PEP_ID=MMETSP0096-20121207/63140_1 /TAXON_ID=311494 /ORGANISM="Alexandrium monilatum, Strain CCMP3105" /LENGTH=180 /DNA_ID=CAMNT_0016916117 /DNA_START=1 /DNA_END=539 /DNA_ORIENTATION=+
MDLDLIVDQVVFTAAPGLWTPALLSAAEGIQRRPLGIYLAAPRLWAKHCHESWGYAYHLERWFWHSLNSSSIVRTAASADADFVYVPQCSVSVYFSRKEARFQALSTVVASAGREELPPAHGSGDLLHGVVMREVDKLYLARRGRPGRQGRPRRAGLHRQGPEVPPPLRDLSVRARRAPA